MKIISVLLMLIMVLLLAGCGKDSVNENTVDDGLNDMSDYSADINDYNDFSEQVQTSNMDKMLNANLQYPSSNDEWDYNVYDCYVEITGYKGGPKETLVVPDEIESLPVWKIAPKAYILIYNESCENIVLPKDLLVIGEKAFCHVRKLKTITLSDSLVVIEDSAFTGCDSLENITLPETLEEIGEEAFYGCHSLKSVVLPKSVKKVGYLAFDKTNLYYDSELGDYKCTGVELTVHNSEMGFHDKSIGEFCLIRGYAGSTAAKYAAEKNIKFEVID